MDKESSIYIAGHSGMVGSSILKKLKVKSYTNLIIRSHKELDLTRQTNVEDFFKSEKIEYVFLAAARVGGILANNTYKAEFIYTNIMIAANVIHSAYRYGVRKLVNLGSSCIYPKFASQPMNEEYLLTGSLEPTNEPYAIAKISAIKLCRYYNEQYGTNFISVMPTNLYGPNDNFDLEASHVLPALIRKFHLAKLCEMGDFEAIRKDFKMYGVSSQKPVEDLTKNDIEIILSKYGINRTYITLWGSGSPYREFLHVDDLAEACMLLMERYNAKDTGELVNIGTGEDIQIKDIAALVKRVIGFNGEIYWDNSKPDGTPRKLLNVERINQLGWKAKTDLEFGIKAVYENYYLAKTPKGLPSK